MDPEIVRRLREVFECERPPVRDDEQILEAEQGGYPTERRSSDNADRLMSEVQNALRDREGKR